MRRDPLSRNYFDGHPAVALGGALRPLLLWANTAFDNPSLIWRGDGDLTAAPYTSRTYLGRGPPPALLRLKQQQRCPFVGLRNIDVLLELSDA